MLAKNLAQVIIIVYGIVWVWGRIVGTQAERLVKGVFVLVAIALGSYFAGFTIITSVLQHMIPVAVMAALIIFQPEIRRGLGYLGRMQSFKVDFSLTDSGHEGQVRDVQQLILAIKELSKSRIGALLVIEPLEGERDYLSPGTPINADISANLLLSIFNTKSPLHDGAVVIRKNKIVAAGVILPMTDSVGLSHKYGTRHRAAIGLSEIYDGLCIVVSEETGSVSAASRGMLVRYQQVDELVEPISYLYQGKSGSESPSLFGTLSNLIPIKESTKDGAALPKQTAHEESSVKPNIDDSALEGAS